MNQSNDEFRELGSKSLWFLSRLVPFTPSVMLLNRGLVFGILFQLVVLAVLWLPNYDLAYGSGDEEGITFRRFIRKHRVSWDDVERVDWNPNLASRFSIMLEHRVGGFRALRFRSTQALPRGQGPRLENDVPEIVLWIADRINLNEVFPASK